MAAADLPIHLTADEIATVQNAMAAMRQGLDTISLTIPGELNRATALSAEVRRIQTKIAVQTSPDVADHAPPVVPPPEPSERCICQHGFKSTGGGRQEVMIKSKVCPVHGKPRPSHLRSV